MFEEYDENLDPLFEWCRIAGFVRNVHRICGWGRSLVLYLAGRMFIDCTGIVAGLRIALGWVREGFVWSGQAC